jgi:hypothetical protein
MPATKLRLIRQLLIATALLASLALSACGVTQDFRSGAADTSSPFSGWGSGWGGNRNWGVQRG